jgi:signal transduction histidine kinase
MAYRHRFTSLFKGVIETLSDGILLRDLRGRVLYANTTLKSLFGHDPMGFRIESLRSLLGVNRKHKDPWQTEFEMKGKDGRSFPVSVFTTRIGNGMDGHAAYLSIFRDISQVKEMQRRILHSEKLATMGRMVAAVVHELNTPLTSVIGFTQLLGHKTVGPDASKLLKKISFEAVRTSKIVQKLLTFARPQKSEKSWVGVNGIIEYLLDLKSKHLQMDHIQVQSRLAPNDALPKVYGDYEQLLEVFLNLINNAQQAMVSSHGGGTLTIETGVDRGTVVIRIRDTGPGLSQEIREQLFQPFQTTKRHGTGLGLHISHTIVKDHSGEIRVESSTDQGTTFVVSLPLSKPALVSGTASSQKAGRRLIPATGLRILVIEDEDTIADLYDHLLTQWTHQPTQVRSPADGLKRLSRQQYDVVIADLHALGTDRERFYRQVKKDHPGLAKRLIVSTGRLLDAKTEHWIKNRRLVLLRKPFLPSRLEEMIRSLSE